MTVTERDRWLQEARKINPMPTHEGPPGEKTFDEANRIMWIFFGEPKVK